MSISISMPSVPTANQPPYNPETDCPQRRAYRALQAHLEACHPCAMLSLGIGTDRFEYCEEFKRLHQEMIETECVCFD